MESLKNTFSSTLKNLEDKIRPLVQDKIKVIEQNHENIFYFSKFTLDKSEFIEIYNFVSIIKQTTIKELLNDLQYAVNSFIVIPSSTLLSEKEKISILFSACFIHYYSTFAYEVANSFDNFYTNEFIDVCKSFNILINDIQMFNQFSRKFYYEVQNVIKRYNYEKIKKMYVNYNYNIIQETKSSFNNQVNNVTELLQQQIFNKNKKNNFFTKNILTHLITAKEHLVDLVLETHQRKNYSGNELIKTIQSITSPGEMEKINNSMFNISNEDSMQIDDSSANNMSVSTASVTDENVSFYSKRILSELTKCEVDEKLKEQIDEITHKVDEEILDVLINQKENTTINMISSFICYIVEVPSSIIKILPEYKNIEYELTLRFIVSAKNIYNRVMEVYFSIFDLKLTNVHTFMRLLKKMNIQIKYADCFFYFFKLLAEEIKKENEWNTKMDVIFEKFIDGLFSIWEQGIQENGKKLTHFRMV